MKPVSRRTLLGISPLALAACDTAPAQYFGRTDPPRTQELVYLLGAEPGTLDPAKSGDLWEAPIIHAMFEGLTSLEPTTGNPGAALATHYEASSDGLQYVFRLRGHPRPRGVALSGIEGPRIPARWSDGRPITAHDFVYSWRRAVTPATAAPNAYLFHYIGNGEATTAGRLPSDKLAVHALDEFSVHIELEAPIPFLLRLLGQRFFFAAPQQAIEAAARRGAESSWIQPGNTVTSGAFTLRQWRPYERILLGRNPTYYDASAVSLEQISFLPVIDGSTSANLYRAGEAAFCMPMSPQLLAGLARKRDVRTCPNFGTHFPVMNTRKPPFNDIRVRYALNMAIDKHGIAAFFGDGRTAQTGVVPPLEGYEPPRSLPVVIDGTSYDVLSYNPEAARSLLIKAGYGSRLKIEYLFPTMPDFKLVAEILQQQWRKNLGIDLALRSQEVQTWNQTVLDVAYNGVAAWADVGELEDPTLFLDLFRSPSTASGTGWTDRHYDDLLAGAKAIAHPGQRLLKLAECERVLLQAMPCLPLYTDVWVYLCKPFLKGITGDPFHGRINNAWIDTNWRPS